MKRLFAGALSTSFALCLGCGSEDADTPNRADDTEDGAVAKFDAVQGAMAACTPKAFQCAGGGSVDMGAVCDLVEDCEDGSDEVPC